MHHAHHACRRRTRPSREEERYAEVRPVAMLVVVANPPLPVRGARCARPASGATGRGTENQRIDADETVLGKRGSPPGARNVRVPWWEGEYGTSQ